MQRKHHAERDSLLNYLTGHCMRCGVPDLRAQTPQMWNPTNRHEFVIVGVRPSWCDLSGSRGITRARSSDHTIW